jgi:hypothetical protein
MLSSGSCFGDIRLKKSKFRRQKSGARLPISAFNEICWAVIGVLVGLSRLW